MMKTEAPEKLRPQRLNQTISYNEFKVRLVNPFTERNGKVINYTVLITTNPNDQTLRMRTLPAWGSIEGRQMDGTYQVRPSSSLIFR